MDIQDICNLQEAYMEVYQELDEAKTPLPVGKMDAKAKELKSKFLKSKPGSPEAGKLISRASQITGTRDSKVVSDSYDLYDIILSHLLDEGYADTQEAAEAIMVNMSEEWRESICEGLGGAKNQGDYDEIERKRKEVRDEHLRKYKSGELPFQKQKKADQAQDFLKKYPKKKK